MALFSFGRKDKNPPEVPVPVAKTQPTPPKIQTPPGTGSFPPVKPPQPTGLMPVTGMPAGTATTQPMAMPRTGATGLKPSRPGTGQSTRSTQRIVLPTPPGSRPNSTKPLTMGTPGGRINLPVGMILRCLPPEVLAEDLSKFEASGAAATEIGLPMNLILGQLPSGKVEVALQDLVPHFPAGYLQPTESIASYLPNLISLPLMDVVMRIPPDLLALRPDQKDVDASVINMADPFTEEILREQAETARRQSQTNIIDESQAPQEEFVPRDQATTTKSVAPPRRPAADPLIPSRDGFGRDPGRPSDAAGYQAAHAASDEQPACESGRAAFGSRSRFPNRFSLRDRFRFQPGRPRRYRLGPKLRSRSRWTRRLRLSRPPRSPRCLVIRGRYRRRLRLVIRLRCRCRVGQVPFRLPSETPPLPRLRSPLKNPLGPTGAPDAGCR